MASSQPSGTEYATMWTSYQTNSHASASLPLAAQSLFSWAPREVRGLIYGHVLGSPTGVVAIDVTEFFIRGTIVLKTFNVDSDSINESEEIDLTLLFVSRQMYIEAKEALFRNDPFALPILRRDNSPRNFRRMRRGNTTHFSIPIKLPQQGVGGMLADCEYRKFGHHVPLEDEIQMLLNGPPLSRPVHLVMDHRLSRESDAHGKWLPYDMT